jgi:hypothetical protein
LDDEHTSGDEKQHHLSEGEIPVLHGPLTEDEQRIAAERATSLAEKEAEAAHRKQQLAESVAANKLTELGNKLTAEGNKLTKNYIRLTLLLALISTLGTGAAWYQGRSAAIAANAAKSAAKTANDTLNEMKNGKGAQDTHALAENAKNQADRTKEISETSRAALVEVQRAFLIPEPQFLNIAKADNRNMVESVQIFPLWNNSGSTPTKHFRMHGSQNYLTTQIPKNFDFPDLWDAGVPHVATPAVVGPRAAVGGPKVTVPLVAEELIANKQMRLFMWGWAKYNDVFLNTKSHLTKYCWEIVINRVSGEAGKADALLASSINCPTHNCYDDECTTK